ncbi:NHL repeat-containing protein [Rhodococcus sp. AG1013]|uniref:hypothetical protein n=1 Tax=Rhodococcus sp. AG1013 TaxID=2183996 RepID=UPI000E0B4086|nr:hypothetical protein [Rhodococcus sp. AG1013]RDI30438.1 NHL repeat-containing protein [Rhodococcus sp. AG1013]
MAVVKKCAVGVAAAVVIAGIGSAGATAAADPLADAGVAVQSFLLDIGVPVPGQTAFAFPTANYLVGVAAENGAVYVANNSDTAKEVLVLPAGASTPSVLPLGELTDVRAVAVENGNVYVLDQGRVLLLAAGQSTPTVLPFAGLHQPLGIAVEDGNVYVADTFNQRVLELPAGASTPTELPFRGLDGGPVQIAVDGGDVYASDMYSKRLFTLPAGALESTVLPYGAESTFTGLTVRDGDVYYVDESNTYEGGFGSLGKPGPGGTVRKVPAGTSTPVTLPFSGFRGLSGIDLDGDRVYIADSGHRQILSLPVNATAPQPGTGSITLPFGS